MKMIQKAGLCGFLLVVLMLPLTACGTQDADIEAAILEHSSEGFTRVSLQEGSTQAAVSGKLDGKMHYGESFPLSAAPFTQDGVFYFPLKDTIPLMGGTCQIEGGTARVHIYERDMIFQVGSPDVIVDGTICNGFPTGDRTPQVVDGVFFLPQGLEIYGELGCFEGPLGRVYPEQNVLILTRTSAFQCELCAAGVWLEEPFDEIPASVRTALSPAGSRPVGNCYTAECMEGDSVAVWVTHAVKSGEDPEAMDGHVVSIQLTGDKYSTWRGLRVGDSRERAELLYGNIEETGALFPSFSFQVEFDETDHVSRITFSANLFSRL